MHSFEEKILVFMSALSNSYKDEDNREEHPKLELKEESLTEDFTAMLYAQFMLYKKITGDDIDILGFTHILNRLAFQDIMKGKEEKEDE